MLLASFAGQTPSQGARTSIASVLIASKDDARFAFHCWCHLPAPFSVLASLDSNGAFCCASTLIVWRAPEASLKQG